MHIDDIRGPQQTGIVEIAALEKERIKGFLASVRRIAIATRHVALQPEAGLSRCAFPRVTGIDAAGPGEDSIIAEASELQDRLGIPIPSRGLAERAETRGMSVLIGLTRSVNGILPRQAK